MPLELELDRRAAALEVQGIGWRREVHRDPELSTREVRTGRLIAAHLDRLGVPYKTQVAYTGVVGLLDTGRPGPVVALRDALRGQVKFIFQSAPGHYPESFAPLLR
jgi:amidohydrolase